MTDTQVFYICITIVIVSYFLIFAWLSSRK